MKIYPDELLLANKINDNTSVSFYLKPEAPTEEERSQIIDKVDQVSTANIKDKDLYYHKAILVTTNWNKNDDVFLPNEVWNARLTPVHKPTNLHHESSKIVGHITDNWAIDEIGNLIPEETETDALPTKFHILTGAVIYKKYHNDPEYQQTVAELIDDIEAGNQYVSMECSFPDFDYAVKGEDGTVSIIKRNESTSFLTKHLKIMGGSGMYEGHRLGRVLRDLSFIGKAYTPKPANSESVIFTQDDIFDFANASISEEIPFNSKGSVVTSSNTDFNGDNTMSDALQAQVTELTSQNSALADEIKALNERLAKADVEKYEEKIASLEAEAETLNETLAKKDEEYKKMKEDSDAMKLKAEKLETKAGELQAELDKAAAEKAFAARVSVLVDGGFDRETAEAKALVFESLSDEQFTVIAEIIVEANKATATEDETEEAAAEETEAEVTEEEEETVADKVDVETSEADTEGETVASETSTEDDTNEALASLVGNISDAYAAKNKTSKGDK